MAVTRTTIEAVRVTEADGSHVVYPWNPELWFQIRDDQPHLDILTRGYPAQLIGKAELRKLPDTCEDGTQWQRWELTELLSRKRRAGEVTAELQNPRGTLRCYVVPTALLGYGDVIAMAEDVEAELGLAGAWDVLAQHPDRTWSRPRDALRPSMPSETICLIEEEMRAAASIRRDPFAELAPRSRLDVPLPENALVTLWAARRTMQLSDQCEEVDAALAAATARADRVNPDRRQDNIDGEAKRLESTLLRLRELKTILAGFVRGDELGAQVHPGPLLQRDHRLRLLLRAFTASPSEAMTESESARSHYPPVFLSRLWELWGAIWLVNEFRHLGFSGACSVEGIEAIERCHWRLRRGTSTVELDFEAEPVLVDYQRLPPAHDRAMPAMEWTARHQKLDADRPFVGTEEKCSPDYLIRITTPRGKSLLVGDACLASPDHHGKKKNEAKPYKVEHYRRTIGWAVGDEVVRCHPMGGFVLFPPSSDNWRKLATLPGASDCMILCPRTGGDLEASRRLRVLLSMAAPDGDDWHQIARGDEAFDGRAVHVRVPGVIMGHAPATQPLVDRPEPRHAGTPPDLLPPASERHGAGWRAQEREAKMLGADKENSPSIRRMGDGYEPHVDEEAGRLTYSLPVDSGLVSMGFSFEIEEADLRMLLADPYRRAVLEVVAHTVLQRSMIRGNTKVTQADFGHLLDRTLHGSADGLAMLVAEIDREYNMSVDHYVRAASARREVARDDGEALCAS